MKHPLVLAFAALPVIGLAGDAFAMRSQGVPRDGGGYGDPRPAPRTQVPQRQASPRTCGSRVVYKADGSVIIIPRTCP